MRRIETYLKTMEFLRAMVAESLRGYYANVTDINRATSEHDLAFTTWEAQIKAGDQRRQAVGGLVMMIGAKIPSDRTRKSREGGSLTEGLS